MGKKSRRRANRKPKRQEPPFVARPFAQLAGEVELIAMRELLPAALMPLPMAGQWADLQVIAVTMLPQVWPALRREDGTILVAMQAATRSGDASRDVAHAIEQAAMLPPGQPLPHLELPEVGVRLQDMVATDAEVSLEICDNFDFWIDPTTPRDAKIEAALEETATQIVPSADIAGVRGAYWCRMGREYLRWVRTEDEYELLDALARLHVAGESALEPGTRLIGFFRSCGLLVPVWELVAGTEADELQQACAAFAQRLEVALNETTPLSAQERSARQGLISREVTLR
ncbi:MAG: DUF5926 family protein [Bowdeniella nasicola]|nr:DUF5926 family protein [Bowdeniella nasicola]